MRQLVRKACLFGVLLVVVFFSLHAGLDALYHTWRWGAVVRSPDTLFVWGDSQTYRGLDLRLLRRHTRRPVLSFAHPGADMLDLLVFVQRVPKGADVLLGLGLPILRREERSFRRSGLSLWAMVKWLQAGGQIRSLGPFLRRNRNPLRSIAHIYAEAHPTLPRPRNGKGQIPSTIPDSFYVNSRLYREALAALQHKGCRIILVEPPMAKGVFPPVFQRFMGDFRKRLLTYRVRLFKAPKPPTQRNAMFDRYHLNAYGRTWMTRQLLPHIFRRF